MKHWIFDLDGTLVDTGNQYFEKIPKIFKHFCVEFNEKTIVSAKDYFDSREYFSIHFKPEQINEACHLLKSLSFEQASNVRLFDGVLELIQFLSNCDVKLSIWTGRDLDSAKAILNHSGLNKYFDICVSGSCVTYKKPHPEGLLKIIDLSGFNTSESVMVGDHVFDLKPAKEIGVRTLGVNWLKLSPCEVTPIADLCFYEIHDLVNWSRQVLIR